jgi:hypothetical protein
MESKVGRARLQDIPTQQLRVSARIAKQQHRPSQKPTGTLKTKRSNRKPEQVLTTKHTELHQKEALPPEPKQFLRKKSAASNQSQQSRTERVTESSISHGALSEHEEKTVDELLPEALAMINHQCK